MASQAETTTTDTGAATLGIERWVQFAFIGGGVFVFWLLDKVIAAVWNIFAEPNANAISIIAAVVGGLSAYVFYRMPLINRWAHEVAAELSKCTWPTRKETWQATIVVLVVSVLSAVIMASFDTVWSWVTDLIYTV